MFTINNVLSDATRLQQRHIDLAQLKKANLSMQVITNFFDRKIIDYLKNTTRNLNVLFDCSNGLGDVIMVMPHIEALMNQFPQHAYKIKTNNGKQCLFGDYGDLKDYDYIFNIPAWFNEVKYKSRTKPECNCEFDLGIKYDKQLDYTWKLPKIERSPLIGVGMFSSCFPKLLNPCEAWAKLLWTKIIGAGLIPIDLTTFQIPNNKNNQTNQPFRFINNNLRDIPPSISNILYIMQHCAGYVGICTGSLHAALTMYPDRVLYLENQFKYQYFSSKYNLLSMNVNQNFNDGIFNMWLSRVKNYTTEN